MDTELHSNRTRDEHAKTRTVLITIAANESKLAPRSTSYITPPMSKWSNFNIFPEK